MMDAVIMYDAYHDDFSRDNSLAICNCFNN